MKKLQGSGVECNICHWQGARFTNDPWHTETVCPNCGSQVRHRMLVALLDGKSTLAHFDEEYLLRGKKILHFAPERQLRDRIKKAAQTYVTTDYDRGDVDFLVPRKLLDHSQALWLECIEHPLAFSTSI